MIRTLRSPLAAVSAAAVSASVLAAMPGHAVVLAPASAQVALAAFVDPAGQLLATAEMAQNYLFGVYYNGGDAPTPGAGEANWTAAGFDQTGGDFLNYQLYQQYALGNYIFVGLAPNSVANASPVLQELQYNWYSYVNAGLTGLTTAGTALAAGVWNFPSAAVTAGQLALQGQFAEALSVLGNAILGPITAAGESLLQAGTYVLSSVVANVGAVVAALPQILTTFAGTAVGSVQVLAQKSAAIAAAVVASLSTLDFEGAWNAAVEGLLGPAGLPGTSLNLTIGSGVQTGPIQTPADIPTSFVPSVRTSYQAAIWTIASALGLQAAPASAAATVSANRLPKPAAADSTAPDSTAPDTAAPDGTAPDATGPDTAAAAAPAARAGASERREAARGRAARTAADRG